VANEGKLVAICPADRGVVLLRAMRAHPLGRDAARIGEVVEDDHRFVQMETRFGGSRIVDWLVARHAVGRDTAVQWAAELMRQGMLRHVFDDQAFHDNGTLYRPA
jgi:hypothetical protein